MEPRDSPVIKIHPACPCIHATNLNARCSGPEALGPHVQPRPRAPAHVSRTCTDTDTDTESHVPRLRDQPTLPLARIQPRAARFRTHNITPPRRREVRDHSMLQVFLDTRQRCPSYGSYRQGLVEVKRDLLLEEDFQGGILGEGERQPGVCGCGDETYHDNVRHVAVQLEAEGGKWEDYEYGK